MIINEVRGITCGLGSCLRGPVSVCTGVCVCAVGISSYCFSALFSEWVGLRAAGLQSPAQTVKGIAERAHRGCCADKHVAAAARVNAPGGVRDPGASYGRERKQTGH